MIQKLKEPLKLNSKEKGKLSNYFYLPDWQFEVLIGCNSTEIEKKLISHDKDGIKYAILYGLSAVNVKTNKPCIYS